MNLYHYAIDFVLASLAITLILHISKCDRKYLTRAEFDEHLAACRDGVVDNPLVYGNPLEVAAKRVEEMRDGNDSRRDSEN